jgi:hypothetical protein
LAQFLVEELACRVALLVIQPAHLAFGRPRSTAGHRAAGHTSIGWPVPGCRRATRR